MPCQGWEKAEVRHSVRQYGEGCSSNTVWCHVRAGRTGNRGKTFSKANSEKAALATQYGAMSGLWRTGNRGKTFSKAIRSEKAALATQYGAMSGLGELGTEVRHSVRQYAQRRLL